jgi:excisionase family DNA binding protein
VNDFCSAYGISRSTLYVLIKGGRIRTIKIGRRRLIPEDEGERIMREGA